LVREWGLTPAWVGLSVGLGGVGALVGTLIVGPVTRRVGIGRALVAALIFAGLTSWIVPAARGSRVFLLIVILATQLLGDIVWPFYFVNDTSLRQAMTPRQLLGRASASTNLVVHGITPLGSVIAGALASLIGLRWTWLFGGIGVGLASLWLIFSPVGRLRALPAASLDPAPSPDGEGACPGSP
jgi:predicted MFS family arabinose efflux permease